MECYYNYLLYYFGFFETRFHCVFKVGLELIMILWPQLRSTGISGVHGWVWVHHSQL